MAVFSEDDLVLLKKTIDIRARVLDTLVNENRIKSAKDVDTLTNLAESIDRSILGKAKVLVEDEHNKNEEQNKEILKAMLLELHTKNSEANAAFRESKEPVYTPVGLQLNEGELIAQKDTISSKDYIG